MALLLIPYIFLGAKANSFLKHNLLGIRTAYVFDMWSFIFNKICLSLIIGWITIPIAFILWILGVGRRVS